MSNTSQPPCCNRPIGVSDTQVCQEPQEPSDGTVFVRCCCPPTDAERAPCADASLAALSLRGGGVFRPASNFILVDSARPSAPCCRAPSSRNPLQPAAGVDGCLVCLPASAVAGSENDPLRTACSEACDAYRARLVEAQSSRCVQADLNDLVSVDLSLYGGSGYAFYTKGIEHEPPGSPIGSPPGDLQHDMMMTMAPPSRGLQPSFDVSAAASSTGGDVNPEAYAALLQALQTGSTSDWSKVQLAPTCPYPVVQSKLVGPQSSSFRSLYGASVSSLVPPPPPSVSSPQTAAEMVELYAAAACRDVPFLSYCTANDDRIEGALEVLNADAVRAAYRGPRPLNDSPPPSPPLVDEVTCGNLFRFTRIDAVADVDQDGLSDCFVSQFLLRESPTLASRPPPPSYDLAQGKKSIQFLPHILPSRGLNASSPAAACPSGLECGVTYYDRVAHRNMDPMVMAEPCPDVDYLVDRTKFDLAQDGNHTVGADVCRPAVLVHNGRTLASLSRSLEEGGANSVAEMYMLARQMLSAAACPLRRSLPYRPDHAPDYLSRLMTARGTFDAGNVDLMLADVAQLATLCASNEQWRRSRRLRPEALGALVDDTLRRSGSVIVLDRALLDSAVFAVPGATERAACSAADFYRAQSGALDCMARSPLYHDTTREGVNPLYESVSSRARMLLVGGADSSAACGKTDHLRTAGPPYPSSSVTVALSALSVADPDADDDGVPDTDRLVPTDRTSFRLGALSLQLSTDMVPQIDVSGQLALETAASTHAPPGSSHRSTSSVVDVYVDELRRQALLTSGGPALSGPTQSVLQWIECEMVVTAREAQSGLATGRQRDESACSSEPASRRTFRPVIVQVPGVTSVQDGDATFCVRYACDTGHGRTSYRQLDCSLGSGLVLLSSNPPTIQSFDAARAEFTVCVRAFVATNTSGTAIVLPHSGRLLSCQFSGWVTNTCPLRSSLAPPSSVSFGSTGGDELPTESLRRRASNTSLSSLDRASLEAVSFTFDTLPAGVTEQPPAALSLTCGDEPPSSSSSPPESFRTATYFEASCDALQDARFVGHTAHCVVRMHTSLADLSPSDGTEYAEVHLLSDPPLVSVSTNNAGASFFVVSASMEYRESPSKASLGRTSVRRNWYGGAGSPCVRILDASVSNVVNEAPYESVSFDVTFTVVLANAVPVDNSPLLLSFAQNDVAVPRSLVCRALDAVPLPPNIESVCTLLLPPTDGVCGSPPCPNVQLGVECSDLHTAPADAGTPPVSVDCAVRCRTDPYGSYALFDVTTPTTGAVTSPVAGTLRMRVRESPTLASTGRRGRAPMLSAARDGSGCDVYVEYPLQEQVPSGATAPPHPLDETWFAHLRCEVPSHLHLDEVHLDVSGWVGGGDEQPQESLALLSFHVSPRSTDCGQPHTVGELIDLQCACNTGKDVRCTVGDESESEDEEVQRDRVANSCPTPGAGSGQPPFLFRVVVDQARSTAPSAVVDRDQRTYLLPQCTRQGAPMCPSYPSSTACASGACALVLKTFFDVDAVMPGGCVFPSLDGARLVHRDLACRVGAEVDKLTDNLCAGLLFDGSHFRSDLAEGILLGERVAVRYLSTALSEFGEPVSSLDSQRRNGASAVKPTYDIAVQKKV